MAAIQSSFKKSEDEKLREKLKKIDVLDVDVSSFEASFLESVLFKYQGPLSEKQRAVARDMIERYL